MVASSTSSSRKARQARCEWMTSQMSAMVRSRRLNHFGGAVAGQFVVAQADDVAPHLVVVLAQAGGGRLLAVRPGEGVVDRDEVMAHVEVRVGGDVGRRVRRAHRDVLAD